MTEENTLLTTIIEGIQERKGKDISIVDLSAMEYATAQGFVICSGTSTMHVSAVATAYRSMWRAMADRSLLLPTGIRTRSG